VADAIATVAVVLIANLVGVAIRYKLGSAGDTK
jgi:hypothetical protein